MLRQAVPADANVIIAGINSVCAEGGYFSTTRFIPTPAWQNAFYHPASVPDHLLVVVEWSGIFAGCGRLFPFSEHSLMRHIAELGMFLLLPYRGQG